MLFNCIIQVIAAMRDFSHAIANLYFLKPHFQLLLNQFSPQTPDTDA